VDRLDESFRHRLIDERRQRRVERTDVQQAARLAVQSELGPGDHFEEFLEGAHAAGHRDESVRKLRHHRLARVHGINDMQFGNAGVGDLTFGKRPWNHANYLAAVSHHRIGYDAHQADVAAAVHQADAAFRQ
jgi:hypothetical protein